MKAALKKYAAALLALLLALSCALPAAAAAMPAGVTEAQAEACIPKADKLLAGLSAAGGEIPDIRSSVYGTLYADETLNALFTAIYQAFGEYESTLTALGLDMSVGNVARALSGWPGVASVLEGKASWAEVMPAVPSFRWGVTGKSSFSGALAGMLAPLNPLLYTLLCGGTYHINNLISVTGAEGYQNAVVPLLQTVGCPAVMSQADFTASAASNTFMIVHNLCGMLFAALDRIFDAPVASLCTYLPGIARYLEEGGVSQTIKTLMEPLTLKIAVFSLPGVSSLLENTDLLSSDLDLKAMLEKADLSALTGGKTDLRLPDLDLAALSACCTGTPGNYVANKGQAFVVILRWALEAVKLNASAVPAEFSSFLNRSSDELLGLLFKILSLSGAARTQNAVFTYPAFTPAGVTYTQNLGPEQFARVLEQIDPTLDEFLLEFTDKGSLSDLVRKGIYSNRLVTELTKALYGALYTEQTAPLLSLLGIAASPAGVADAVRAVSPAAARALSAYGSWDKVNADRVSWGFSDGNRNGFTAAVTAVLRPFAPMLRFLLAEGSLNLFDAVQLGGSNGYESAVIPILEGLGCDASSIVPYGTYKAAGDTALITHILTPVTALLDRLCERPVDTLCGMLPQLAYFLDSDLLQQCLRNLLYPVTALLNELGMQDLLPADLTKAELPDAAALTAQLTQNSGLNLKLPAPDLSKVKALGVAQSLQSVRTGGPSYTFIAADKPAVLLTVLRYVLGAVKESGDVDLMGSFSMGGGETDGPDMMATYTAKTVEKLKSMTVDETIEWLYDLLFAETPQREQTTEDDFIPTIIYDPAPDHTVRNRVLIGAAVFALVVGLTIFLVKYDFQGAADRRKRRRSGKAREKEAIAAAMAATARPRDGASMRRLRRQSRNMAQYYNGTRRG